jgi:C4-dicarboxylate transporter
MRFLWYALSVLSLIAGISQIMKESLSGAQGIGFIVGALLLPVVFFLLGRRASKIAARTKTQQQEQAPR